LGFPNDYLVTATSVKEKAMSVISKEPGETKTPESSQGRDEAQLRQLIADQMSAIRAKDVGRLMNLYALDAAVLAAKPPFQAKWAHAWRRTWEACLPYFPDSFQTRIRDLGLTIRGDLALAHWLWRFTGNEKGHAATQTWFRGSASYRRIRGKWQIVHEPAFAPFS
jgi:ketosteroid isomerase-like protein